MLCGDAGMVHSRNPAGFKARHALVAHIRVLEGIVQDVPHVQHAGHIGWGNDNCVWALLGRSNGMKHAVRFPKGVPFLFDFCGCIRFGERCRLIC